MFKYNYTGGNLYIAGLAIASVAIGFLETVAGGALFFGLGIMMLGVVKAIAD
jgi:hypothetical protein